LAARFIVRAVASIFEPLFDEDTVRYEFRYRRARLGYQAGCERLGVSLWELPPGAEGIYHLHHGNEELLAVLSGRPSLRTPAGWRELERGEVAAFPRGPRGAHVVANRGSASVRLLFFSEMRGPEVVLYPHAGTVGALEAMSSPERGGFAAWLRVEDAFERHDQAEASPDSCPAAVPTGANLFDPVFDDESERPGFQSRRARLGRQAGGERLGASLYELPPGQAAWPFHFHLANEELLVAVSGTSSLRTPAGSRTLEEGEVTALLAGEQGAHQVRNEGGAPVRVLIVSQMVSPDVVVHVDSGKVGVRGAAPGAPETGALHEWFALGRGVDFWDGE
jgi:uncharacterized cupin superfamily protein